MITLNLLPDSRLERIKTAKKQRSIGAFATLAIVAGVAVPVILLIVWLGQRGILVLTQRSIDRKVGELQAVENLDTILTTQNQLNTLPTLNQQRLFHTTFLGLLPKLLPEEVDIATLRISEGGTITINGEASSSALIEDFVAVLNRAELFQGTTSQALFGSVTPNSISPVSDGGATFEITFTAEQTLFSESFPHGIRVASKVLKTETPAPAPQPNQPPQ